MLPIREGATERHIYQKFQFTSALISSRVIVYGTVLCNVLATDKDWRAISKEEIGLSIVKVLEKTAVCPLNACRTDGFTLLHLAALKGYPNMMHRLLSLKVCCICCIVG